MLKRLLPFIILIARVSVAEGQSLQWSELGAGAGALKANGAITCMCVDYNNNLYAAGSFTDTSGKLYVAKWNGTSWSELGTGLYSSVNVGPINAICVDYSNNIYVAGNLVNSSGYYYVAVWNGSAWSELGAGYGSPLDANGPINLLIYGFNGIYAAGNFTEYAGGPEYVATCPNGQTWEGNADGQPFQGVVMGLVNNDNFTVYAGILDFPDSIQEPVAVYTYPGSWWITGTFPQIQEISAFGCDNDNLGCLIAQPNVTDYDPITFAGGYYVEETPSAATQGIGFFNNGAINTFCPVTSSGMLAGGTFLDSTGHEFVALLHAPSIPDWMEVGTGTDALNANGAINALTIDYSGNIYAAGAFTDSSGHPYVAKFSHHTDVLFNAVSPVCKGSIVTLNPLIFDYAFENYSFTYLWKTLNGSPLSCNTCLNPTAYINENSTYYIKVTALNGDTASASITYIADSSENHIVTTFSNTQLGCNLDSTAINVTGANPPHSIAWGDNNISESLTQSQTGHDYDTGGIFNIIVTDNIGCTVFITDTLPLLALSLVQNISAGCLHNGQLTVSASEGNPPYSFSWSNGDSVAAISNLLIGSYTVTVTDATACSVSATFNVTYHSYYVFLDPTNTNCGNNGSILTQVSAGTPPYSFLWSNSNTSSNLNELSSRTYTVTVTDSTGCAAYGRATILAQCSPIVSGTVFIDTSGNCQFNGTQQIIPNVLLTLSGGAQTLYATTDNNGKYSFQLNDTGTYHIYVQVGNNNFCGNFTMCGNPTQTINATGLSDSLVNNNFALKPDSSSFDLFIHPGWTPASPGFEKDYWIYFGNESPVPYNGPVTVAFKYDSNLNFLSSDIPYTTYDSLTDSITWLVNNFDNSTWDRIGNIRFMLPERLSPDYLLHSQFWIYPYSGDCDTSNNYLSYYDPVKGSHDPNAKTVSPSGNVTNSDSVLTYTVYYQNDGTDSTYFIIVKDTLSPYLDPSTVRNLASSNEYSSFTISGAGILTWTFNPLRLVDSATNPNGSKGFIVYSVKMKANLPLGVAVDNSASVYFDYNPAVVTDTIMNAVCSNTAVAVSASICNGENYYVGNIAHNRAGNYLDTIQNFYGCDSIISLQLSVDTVIAQLFQPSPDTLIVTGTGDITWIDCSNNQVVESVVAGTLVPQVSGTYAAIVTSGNCSDTTECVTVVVNGIQGISGNNMRISPNPADNYVYVEMGKQGNYEFQLWNGLGQLVDFKETRQVDIFNTEGLASGVYFIKVIDESNAMNSITKKVVIAH